MRYLALLWLCLGTALAAPPILTPQDLEKLDDEQIIQTIEHMGRNSRILQDQLTEAQKQLVTAKAAHASAQTSADTLQVQVTALAKERDTLAGRVITAEEKAKKFEGLYHRLKWGCCLLGAGLAAFAAWQFLSPLVRLLPTLAAYAWAVPVAAGTIVFGLLLALL